MKGVSPIYYTFPAMKKVYFCYIHQALKPLMVGGQLLIPSLSVTPSTDVESVMNSIVSLLLILETDKQEALIESLCEKLVKFREGERPSLRMQL